MRGCIYKLSSIDRPVPPHPDRICAATRPLPASGARLKRTAILSRKLGLDRSKNALSISENVVVPKSKNFVIFLNQTTVAYCVRSRLIVLSAVDLNDQTPFSTNEIADVTQYRFLPDELMPVDLPVADAIPENYFRVRLINTQSSCDSDGFVVAAAHCLALQPDSICDAIRPLPAKGRGEVKTYPTSPLIGFTGALSGKTLSASTRSASPS